MAIVNVEPTYEGTAARLAQQNSAWHISGDDQSSPPDQNNRRGNYVYWFDLDVDGSVAGDYEMRRFREDGPGTSHDLQDGDLIVGGFIHVLEEFNAGNHHIDVVGAADIVASGTTMNSTGIKNILPDPSDPNGTGILLAAAGVRPVLTLGGTVTSGIIMLYLDVVWTNP